VHTGWGRRALVERCGVAPGRVRVSPHGELGYLRQAPAVPAPADAPGPTVLLPGLIRPYKGADLLLAAWPRVRERVSDARLVIAGRPMLDLAALPTGQPGVQLIPRYVDDAELAALLRRADVVALPYRSIDSSGVVFAALALGAALVLSDVGGFHELHAEHGVGELVPAGDAGALAAVLAAVLADPARRDALREASRAAAAGPFGWGSIAAATEAVYLELIR
jgi:glycosyltransferase involved in cell wall biosynthesis